MVDHMKAEPANELKCFPFPNLFSSLWWVIPPEENSMVMIPHPALLHLVIFCNSWNNFQCNGTL